MFHKKEKKTSVIRFFADPNPSKLRAAVEKMTHLLPFYAWTRVVLRKKCTKTCYVFSVSKFT